MDSKPTALRQSIPGISWVASRCLQAPPHPLACHHCAKACPAGALDFHEGKLKASDACHGCAQCVAACPTEALVSAEITQVINSLPAGKSPELGCHRAGDEPGKKRLHCLRALGPDQLAWLRMQTMPGQVALYLPDACQGCLAGPQDEEDSWLEHAKGLCRVTTAPAAVNYHNPSYAVSRRSLLLGRSVPPLPNIEADDSAPKARRLQRHLHAASKLEETLPLTLPGLALEQHTCHGHSVCARVCPTTALQKTPDGELIFNAMECLDCGHCLTACPEGALKAGKDGQPVPVMLHKVEQADCFECGRPFAPEDSTTAVKTCPACRRESELMRESFRELFG
jgi:Fe-S-cluster-containing hydrogenase component 2